ncbi:YadA C-terminal domain-containing protein [Pasteurella sp. P03HT]
MKKIILMGVGCIALVSASSTMAIEPFKSKYYLYNNSTIPDDHNKRQLEGNLSKVAIDSMNKKDVFIISPLNNGATILDLIDHVNDLSGHTQYNINQINRKYSNMMASQMAVGNLFQPYSVKKFNLTAAVGQYRSSSSIAVGTGYRFNENVAARASASFVKGGRTGFGAGINLEY